MGKFLSFVKYQDYLQLSEVFPSEIGGFLKHTFFKKSLYEYQKNFLHAASSSSYCVSLIPAGTHTTPIQ